MKPSLGWAAAAAFLVAGRAWAGPAELRAALGQGEFLQAAAVPAAGFQGLRAIPQRPPADAAVVVAPDAAGAPIATVALPSLLDNVRRTKATFRAGSVVVHVFGGKSQNKDNWFIGFAPEEGDAQFRSGHKMIHWGIVLNRTVHFEIAGHKFSAYLEGKPLDRMQSVVVVQPADKSVPASRWTIQELSDDAFAAGAPVTIGGKEYRLMYTRDFNENDRGEFDGYTSDRSITLMTREGGKMVGYHWFEREIPRDHILISTPKASGADDDQAGTLTVGLRADPAGALEIYSRR